MDLKSVKEFIREDVADWDDELIATARFKAFSGQRSDWEPKFQFWKDLIVKISRHFGLFIISPSQVKNEWFSRGGLTPLCIGHVLFIMCNEGEIIRNSDLADPFSGRISQLFWKVKGLLNRSTMTAESILLEDHVVVTTLLKEKADEVVKGLSESHWTSNCIVTRKKFESMCGGPEESYAVLSYFSGCGKGQYLSTKKKELIEGIKVSLSSAAVSSVSSLDFDTLHLIWTQEKLQQQLDVIDRRWEMSRQSALTSLKSGNKKLALRQAREMKLATVNREKCTSLLNRVEEVLSVIANAESTKKVTEAIQIGARAIKENKISVEEVQLCLEELDESIDSQKQVEKALESAPYLDVEDEDIEEEFGKLELEVGSENLKDLIPEAGLSGTAGSNESLADALSNLKLVDAPTKGSAIQNSGIPAKNKESKSLILEAA
ncbi:charged multivesicular body protein 7 isoform X2 [Durio zibethinus]|uniref:Charged multivesicular body protein 7 isoform X2 n=1 Tax=Durio zibethinus TaxID=66656 RepID=A0A6P5ZYW6_DURZI|nr:charged multivesicular body protein 7 isoform X2 [Durio zibethinus]